jgi:hypothetical protein
LDKLCLLGLQHVFVFIQLTLRHDSALLPLLSLSGKLFFLTLFLPSIHYRVLSQSCSCHFQLSH